MPSYADYWATHDMSHQVITFRFNLKREKKKKKNQIKYLVISLGPFFFLQELTPDILINIQIRLCTKTYLVTSAKFIHSFFQNPSSLKR